MIFDKIIIKYDGFVSQEFSFLDEKSDIKSANTDVSMKILKKNRAIFSPNKIQKLLTQTKENASYFMGFRHIVNPWSILLVFWVITSCFCLEFTLAIDSLRVNQSLRDSEVLVSNGQTCKLGFFSPVNSSYRYVGVMYNIPVLTVIWVANRDNPLNDSAGTVEISEDGNLVVLDGQKGIVWSSNISDPVANSSVYLLDTGNLVLQDSLGGMIVWESFQHATDSFMREMRIMTDLSTNESNKLTSWRSPSDPALGSFTASIETLEFPQLVVRNRSGPYWRSGPWDGQIFIGIPGMETYWYKNGIDIVKDNPATAYMTFTYFNTSNLIYFVLNASGILYEKGWSDGYRDWGVIWSSIENECDVYGRCGPYGTCDAQATPICTCLPGFEPKNIGEWDAANWTSGCTRKTSLQCENNNSVGGKGKQDGFVRLKTVKLPDRFRWSPTVEADCENRCLDNCSCIAYSYYRGIGCMLWNESLIDVQKFSSGGGDLYIRLAHSEIDNKKDAKVIVAITLVLGFITVTVSACFLLKWYRGRIQKNWRLFTRNKETESLLKENFELEELPFFKFDMLLNATSNFDSIFKLGEGGFGPVYKGKLPNGQEIAVKRLARSSNQGLEEFKNEVEVISKLQHWNLVRILGCCVEHEEKMLVYEYMPNGSLDAYLFDSCKQEFLDWKIRKSIIEGICRGLLYLHRDSRLRIIHRDLKASNILLDQELNPKISDFGMARIFGRKENQANTKRVVGTFGYMAPEYALQGKFSEKSDVYSFGVLLLEILSGRQNTGFYNDDEAQSLVAYAWMLWNEEKITNLIDVAIYDPQMKPEIVRYAHVGLLCVQEIAQHRPNISTVLSMLGSEIVDLPCPNQPAFTVHQRSPEKESSNTTPCKLSRNDVTVTIIGGR